MATTLPPINTALEEQSAYNNLPPAVQTFASQVASRTYPYCPLYTSQLTTASFLAQWPEIFNALMAGVNTAVLLWRSVFGTRFISSVTDLYLDWLGQPAV